LAGRYRVSQELTMRIDKLARKIDAKVITCKIPNDAEIDRFYAGEKISGLLSEACDKILVLSSRLNPHIFRVVGLLDIPAICLLDNQMPTEETLQSIMEQGIVLLVSPVGLRETAKRLSQCLGRGAGILHAHHA
jgi:hypothetical protein